MFKSDNLILEHLVHFFEKPDLLANSVFDLDVDLGI